MALNPFVARRARVVVNVTRPNSQGQPAVQTYTFVDHRMKILVRQGGKQFGNAKVEVFGVPKDAMNQIARLWLESLTPQNTDTLNIDVWDGQNFVPFFQGVITWSAVDASAMPHVKLVIEANEFFQLLNMSASPYSNPGPVLLSDALKSIAALGGFALDYSKLAPDYFLSNIYEAGSPGEQIDRLMRHFPDLTWFANLQRIIVRKVGAPVTQDSVRIAASEGMQGFPTYSTSGLQFQTIFDPLLRPGVALDVRTPFTFVNRTLWVAAVLAHTLDVNVPNGHWTTAVAANSFGAKVFS